MYPVVAVRPSRATVGWEGHWEDAVPVKALERILSVVDEVGWTPTGLEMLDRSGVREPSERVVRTPEQRREDGSKLARTKPRKVRA